MANAAQQKQSLDADEKFHELHTKVQARLTRISAPKHVPNNNAMALDEFDTRARERVVATHPALVICEEDEDTPGTIVDMSADGLRLRFAKPHYLPPTILIDSPAFSGFIVADVKWQSGNEAGIAFDHLWTQKLSSPIRPSKNA